CMQAAEQTGIGFTALPVLYRYGGFGSTEPVAAQKRFINDTDSFCRIVEVLRQASKAMNNVSVGIAPHSLRAVDKTLLSSVLSNLGIDNLAAVHIHIAEQLKEVDDCVSWSGRRPVDWLFDHFEVDSKWCLIHATHMDENETRRMAESGCVAGLCPTTEANLGDGFFNMQQYNRQNGKWAIGSDSHISIDPVEELRWLEYGTRLLSHRRNVLLSAGQSHTGRSLLDASWQGGKLACGRKTGSIEVGYRADFIVLDTRHPRLYARREDSLLDSWIFAGNQNPVQHVYVGGRQLIKDGRHVNEEQVAANYRRTLHQLAG
ncbi:MAG: formimidoylglutamate deiminase, partial [Gammaproteobacteria bacterium]|nr:formimidoylglutamate deiminase [Gammaproteobacteria bacterium]